MDTKFLKLHADVRHIDTIKQHITDQGEQHMIKDQKPLTATNIPLNVPSDREVDLRNMLQKYEHMWSRQLGEININEMRSDLVPDAKPFKSHPYRACPKTG